MFMVWTLTGVPDVGFTVNGVLAGLVGITAGADAVAFPAAVLVGVVAGIIMVVSIIALERVGIDDPVGAISVHGTAGLWGVIAVALFGGAGIFIQAVGALAIIAWTFTTSLLVFKLVDLTVGVRVSREEEIGGLDRSEHGGEAYPGFVFQEQMADPKLLDPVGSNGH